MMQNFEWNQLVSKILGHKEVNTVYQNNFIKSISNKINYYWYQILVGIEV
jgi:hypothetical protein